MDENDGNTDLMNETQLKVREGHRRIAWALCEFLIYKRLRREHIDNKRIIQKPLLFGIEDHVTYRGHVGQQIISFLHNKNNK